MTSDKELWEKNKDSMYSELKDGEPKTAGQRILGIAYLIVLIILSILTAGLFWTQKHIIQLRVILPYIVIGALSGWTWNLYCVTYDPNCPGWLYHPWSIIGIDYHGMVLEDFIFYLICGSFFYGIRNRIVEWSFKIRIKINIKNSILNKQIVIISAIVLSGIFFIISADGGKSIFWWFAIPGISMLLLTFYRWDINRFLLTLLFVIIFAGSWDMITGNIIPHIPGLAWAKEWVYQWTDASGIIHHSKIWSFSKYMWVKDVPIEIMPWFSIAGGIFIYGLAETCEKYLGKK